MMPKFASTIAWQQAEQLMQPVFIRVVDNLRKELDQSSWRGTYQEVPIWAENTPDDIKATVTTLQNELQTASPERRTEIQATLAQLPQPHPGYYLCLQKGDREVTVDLWQLCYQICFRNYNPVVNLSDNPTVDIDTNLIEADTGEVDWVSLDNKAKQVISQIFTTLPSVN
ncbi:hypothetical protein H6G89_02025 [Oscillatoria sp. FACHB-1407]|uniref:hypothetical protein n=1 Tax=Oscillatoria sp. FACHB-1407 TaxID=2692847 RepID=UPI0016856E38|nr:hypothetical protein [Oscillatoria sp. FACHB-1407]MBD2459810.1 hypothetical protein [Oscillatoria sp. FACHB-1407]